MNKYIVFTENSMNIIDESFTLAVKIWGGKNDNVRVIVGNYAGYGQYLARYHRATQIIEIPLNKSFSDIKISNNGIEVIDASNDRFKGTLLHELAHHYVSENEIELDFEAGPSTHSSKEWCYICSIGWKYFTPELDVSPELIARGIRTKVEGLAESMRTFSPYKPPIAILDSISKIDGHEKVCICCKDIFISKRSDAKYCSSKCKVKYNRQLKKEKRNLFDNCTMNDQHLYTNFKYIFLQPIINF